MGIQAQFPNNFNAAGSEAWALLTTDRFCTQGYNAGSLGVQVNSLPSDGDYLIINGIRFTWRTSADPYAGNELQIGANEAECVANLYATTLASRDLRAADVIPQTFTTGTPPVLCSFNPVLTNPVAITILCFSAADVPYTTTGDPFYPYLISQVQVPVYREGYELGLQLFVEKNYNTGGDAPYLPWSYNGQSQFKSVPTLLMPALKDQVPAVAGQTETIPLDVSAVLLPELGFDMPVTDTEGAGNRDLIATADRCIRRFMARIFESFNAAQLADETELPVPVGGTPQVYWALNCSLNPEDAALRGTCGNSLTQFSKLYDFFEGTPRRFITEYNTPYTLTPQPKPIVQGGFDWLHWWTGSTNSPYAPADLRFVIELPDGTQIATTADFTNLNERCAPSGEFFNRILQIPLKRVWDVLPSGTTDFKVFVGVDISAPTYAEVSEKFSYHIIEQDWTKVTQILFSNIYGLPDTFIGTAETFEGASRKADTALSVIQPGVTPNLQDRVIRDWRTVVQPNTTLQLSALPNSQIEWLYWLVRSNQMYRLIYFNETFGTQGGCPAYVQQVPLVLTTEKVQERYNEATFDTVLEFAYFTPFTNRAV